MALKRVMKERYDIEARPVPNCVVKPQSDFVWQAMLTGPPDSPFKDGKFILHIEFPKDYPFRPPEIKFVTKIFHPNVDSEGKINLDILGDNWFPRLTIGKVLISLSSLLPYPDVDFPLVPEIAELYKTNRAKYNEKATAWTRRYASGSKL